MIIFLILLSTFLSFDANAENITIKNNPCSIIEKHIPDTNVYYQPGVDVNGNAVVPADLNASVHITVPENIQIPITIDLAQFIGINDPLGFLSESQLGQIEYNTKTNKMYYNGLEITQTLNKFCANKEEEKVNDGKE